MISSSSRGTEASYPRFLSGFPVISENQGFIEHHGRRLDRGGSRTGMMGSPRHGVSPLQAPVLVENSSAAVPYSSRASEVGWTQVLLAVGPSLLQSQPSLQP